jgi:5-methylcytosine-specific restriction endonuclease McrA
MGRGFKGKTCVYCAAAPAATMDHVFAREFFLVDRRANLPKVPACQACNGAKSDLEHYLTAVCTENLSSGVAVVKSAKDGV